MRSTNTAGQFVRVNFGQCKVPGCTKDAVCHQMCQTHNRRNHLYGSPTAGRTAPDPNSYSALHNRVLRARGPAKTYECVHCLEDDIHTPARDWATIHGLDGTDPWEDYVPLCKLCHNRYDYGTIYSLEVEEASSIKMKANWAAGVYGTKVA